MKKTAICGVWHVHAPHYTREALECTEVLGVWEEDEQRREEFCKEFHLPAFSSLDELLASDAEGVIVCSSTESHPDIMIKIANAKKHIFTEKVLTLTDEDCSRVIEAIEKNNVNFAISLVYRYDAGPLTVKQIAESGELGKINYMRCHNCHPGSIEGWLPKHFYSAKECGGGAMMDLGAHGMYLADWICGTPDIYKSIFTNSCTVEKTNEMNSDGVEDNAVTVMGYANGCIALNETSFVSSHYPLTLEVCGEHGFVRFHDDIVEKCTYATDGKIVSVPLCPDLPSPLQQFLSDNILDGCGTKEAATLTHMMVEAYRS